MTKTASSIVVLAGVLAGLLFFKGFLVPVAIGLFFASILLYLRKKRKLQTSSILLWYTFVLIVVFLGLRWGGSELLSSLQELLDTTSGTLQSIISTIQSRTGFPLEQSQQGILDQARRIAGGIPLSSIGVGLGSIVLDTILIIVYSYLFVLYEKRIVQTLQSIDSSIEDWRNIGIKKNAQYIGSLFIIAGILSILYAVVLLILGVEYAIMIAILAALGTLVPTIGTALGILGASVATYALTQSITDAVLILVIFEGIQLVEEYFIMPVIAGKKLEINPMATILIIVFGGVIWGIAGVFLALPIASILQYILERNHKKHRFVSFTKK